MKQKSANIEILKGYSDIFAYTCLLVLALFGFVADLHISRIAFFILLGMETFLLALNWILIVLAPVFLKVEIGTNTIKRVGMLRTSNHIVTLIFKVPMTLALAYLTQPIPALLLISTLFFEEHRVMLIERAFFIIKKTQ